MQQQPDRNKKNDLSYLRYSGIGFQIAAITAMGFFIGYELDKYLNTGKPYFAMGFSVVFLILALYVGLKDFGKK